MKQFAPIALFVLAIVTVALVCFGDNSFSSIGSLRQSLIQQRLRNAELSQNIEVAKQEAYGLQHSKRALEKAARSEVGMARPDELIYLFER